MDSNVLLFWWTSIQSSIRPGSRCHACVALVAVARLLLGCPPSCRCVALAVAVGRPPAQAAHRWLLPSQCCRRRRGRAGTVVCRRSRAGEPPRFSPVAAGLLARKLRRPPYFNSALPALPPLSRACLAVRPPRYVHHLLRWHPDRCRAGSFGLCPLRHPIAPAGGHPGSCLPPALCQGARALGVSDVKACGAPPRIPLPRLPPLSRWRVFRLPRPFQVVPLRLCHLVAPERYPRLTLVGQVRAASAR